MNCADLVCFLRLIWKLDIINEKGIPSTIVDKDEGIGKVNIFHLLHNSYTLL